MNGVCDAADVLWDTVMDRLGKPQTPSEMARFRTALHTGWGAIPDDQFRAAVWVEIRKRFGAIVWTERRNAALARRA